MQPATKLLSVICLTASLSTVMAQNINFDNNSAGVLYLGGSAPVIDGVFDEWLGLSGSTTDKAVYGGVHKKEDAEGFFILRADSRYLYIYADVHDDLPNANDLPAPIAWRNDSVEVYVGTNTAKHNRFLRGDNHIRLVPVSKTDPKAIRVSINDREIPNGIKGSVVFSADGYRIEAAIPLNLLMISSFELDQLIRLDFQVNDADRTERDRLLHWNSPRDDTYHNPESWGNGRVLPFPQH